MPCDYSIYPPDWKTMIRLAVIERAGNCCEFCGAENHEPHPETGSLVVLTVAHLDHDPENWNVTLDRLAALCQKCHNAYDAPMRAANRKRKQEQENNQRRLFDIGEDRDD